MITIFTIFLLLPLPILLNRMRGTGTILNIFGFRLIGNIIYAFYIALLIGFATAISSILLPFSTIVLNGTEAVYVFENSQFFSSFIFALVGVALYIGGESYSFGKWVGYLVSPNGAIEYENEAGTKFPFIHQTANFFVPQIKNYRRYCQLALSIRGFYWWTPIIILLACIGLINWYVAVLNSIVLAVGFPIACELSKHIRVKWIKLKFLIINENWHIQELIYGLIHFICLNLSIFLTLYLKG